MCSTCDEWFEDAVTSLDDLLAAVSDATSDQGFTPGQQVTNLAVTLMESVANTGQCQHCVIQTMALQLSVAVHRLIGAAKMGVTL